MQLVPYKQNIFDRLKKNFDEAYQKYLEMKGLQDTPLNKGGFYAIAELLIDGDPIGDDQIQPALVEYLAQKKFDALQDELDAVDMLMLQTAVELEKPVQV